MGPKPSKPPDSAEDFSSRLSRSSHLFSERKRRRFVLSSMHKRALTSSALFSSTALCSLPEPALVLILECVPSEIRTLLAVSPLLHFRISEAVEHAFNPIESGFAIMHSHLITFKKSRLYCKRIKASGKEGLRVDRVLLAEILPILKNFTVKLRYNYKYHRSDMMYTAEFKIDCVELGKRTVWCHRDESRFHGADQIRAYSQQIPTVCVGDSIELALNWFSLYGLIRLDTITWQPPILHNSKNLLRSLQSPETEDAEIARKKHHLYKISRNCEPEVNSAEWYDARYYPQPDQANKEDCFLPFLRMIKFEFTGSEIIVSKSTFRAEMLGIVPDSMNLIGVWVEVIGGMVEMKQEVKRLGLLYDRHTTIRLRIGDELVIYVSRGG
jgi:hypothetical protein